MEPARVAIEPVMLVVVALAPAAGPIRVPAVAAALVEREAALDDRNTGRGFHGRHDEAEAVAGADKVGLAVAVVGR